MLSFQGALVDCPGLSQDHAKHNYNKILLMEVHELQLRKDVFVDTVATSMVRQMYVMVWKA